MWVVNKRDSSGVLTMESLFTSDIDANAYAVLRDFHKGQFYDWIVTEVAANPVLPAVASGARGHVVHLYSNADVHATYDADTYDVMAQGAALDYTWELTPGNVITAVHVIATSRVNANIEAQARFQMLYA